jgi:hypothetical protein
VGSRAGPVKGCASCGRVIETLSRVSSKLGIEFTIDVRPVGARAYNVTKRAQGADLSGSLTTVDTGLLVAARAA